MLLGKAEKEEGSPEPDFHPLEQRAATTGSEFCAHSLVKKVARCACYRRRLTLRFWMAKFLAPRLCTEIESTFAGKRQTISGNSGLGGQGKSGREMSYGIFRSYSQVAGKESACFRRWMFCCVTNARESLQDAVVESLHSTDRQDVWCIFQHNQNLAMWQCSGCSVGLE